MKTKKTKSIKNNDFIALLEVSSRTKGNNLGPVSQRVAINRTMDINRSSMANRVKLAINRNPF